MWRRPFVTIPMFIIAMILPLPMGAQQKPFTRVAPTLPFMSATVKKPGQARVRTHGERCCACCRSAPMHRGAPRGIISSTILSVGGKTLKSRT